MASFIKVAKVADVPEGSGKLVCAILAEIGRSEPTTAGALADALVMDAGGLAHTLKPLCCVRRNGHGPGLEP